MNPGGKSTFVLSLLRLLDPRSGSITVDGTNISEIVRSAVRQKCFISAAQDPFLLPDATLRFDMDPNEHCQDEEITAALEKTRLWNQFSQCGVNGHHPLPTGDRVEDQVTTSTVSHILDSPLSSLPQLSTGEQQLLSLARSRGASCPTSLLPQCNPIHRPYPDPRHNQIYPSA